MTTPDDDIRLFKPLGRYDYPANPTRETVKRLWDRLKERIRRNDDDDAPLVASDNLRSVSDETLDEVVRKPAYGKLLKELDASLEDWLAGGGADTDNVRVVVLPPCDDTDILAGWAKDHGMKIVPAPARNKLLSAPTKNWSLPKPAKGETVVVTNVERWFLRHADGLSHVEALLNAVDQAEGRIVIGCNSWAWKYLCKAVRANRMLPRPITFAAFDAERLYNWFRAMAAGEGSTSAILRFVESGDEVFAGGEPEKTEDDAEPDVPDFFLNLAATSYGIPWVAWHMWRESLRRQTAGEPVSEEIDQSEDKQTLWVSALAEFTLPEADDQAILLTLQALLLHGGLSTDELDYVTPFVGHTNTLRVLSNAGLVERDGSGPDARWYCSTIAYPAIRRGLASAGLPRDSL